MKLGFYHYYFRERSKRKPPRFIHDIRPILNTYIGFDRPDWKKQLKTDDGEHLFLMNAAKPGVYMIVGTRNDDLIQAINTKKMTCEDLTTRLKADEEAGFAGYFALNHELIGVASTLRGPKAAAIPRLVNHLTGQLGAGRWALELMPIGISVTLDEAKEIQHVTRTSIRVKPESSFFSTRFAELLATDDDNIGSIEVIIRARRGANLHEAVKDMTEGLAGSEIDKMTLRGKAVLDDELTDYFVAQQGNLSEQISSGTASQVANSVATRFAQNKTARDRVVAMRNEAVYAGPDQNHYLQDLALLADPAHWVASLPSE